MTRFITAVIVGIAVAGIHLYPPSAASSEAKILVEECHKQLKLGESGCACIGERANRILNEKQQQLVVAMVTQNQTAGDELRSQLSEDETAGAVNFMNETPGICANQ